MSVTDLAREAAERYCATMPFREWVEAVLERLGVPPSRQDPEQVAVFARRWRRLTEEHLVQHFTEPELQAVARVYDTPEGRSIMRKMLAFTTTVTPMIEAEVLGWVRRITSASEG